MTTDSADGTDPHRGSTRADGVDAPPVIAAHHLVKRFGTVEAVNDLSFTVAAGQVLGLLGPNGAGKSTAIRMLTTLLPIDGGAGSVGGFDVVEQAAAVRQLIGVAGQSAAIDEKLTARENLELFGRLYKIGRAERRRRIADLVVRFDMSDFADRPAHTYSGGQRRRLDVVAALIADPAALFLDEPTIVLDPRSRAEIWNNVRDLAADGTAIVLTTQYLEEADQLADHILLIDRGRQVAAGSPEDLKREHGRDVLELRFVTDADFERAHESLDDIDVLVADADRRRIDIALTDGVDRSLQLLRRVEDEGASISDFRLRRPTLDDVFLSLTDPNDHPSDAGRLRS